MLHLKIQGIGQTNQFELEDDLGKVKLNVYNQIN